MNDVELGWVAGFLEGEGCFTVTPPSPKRQYIRISAAQAGSPEVLRKLQDLTGVGTINGPRRRDNQQLFWRWDVQKIEDTASLIELIYSLMSERRQERMMECISERVISCQT